MISERVGAATSVVVDTTYDAAIAVVAGSRIAATAFGKGYSEQHAKNVAKRERKAAERTRLLESLSASY